MAWRVAKSLIKLREQIDEQWPNRSTASDGTIGDEQHATTNSDHNPWVKDDDMGVVTAMDITHDPEHGVNNHAIAAQLVKSRDSRIKYIIWNHRIISSYATDGKPAWTWRPYTKENPHTKHFHISVEPVKSLYDSTRPWKFVAEDEVTPQDIEKIADRVVVKLLNARLRNPNHYSASTPEATVQTWLTYRLARTDDLRAEAKAIRELLTKEE